MSSLRSEVIKVILDSYYCYQALTDDLSVWIENGFRTAKGKAVSHEGEWLKINELRQKASIEVHHQKSHVKKGDYWKGNSEVDKLVQSRRLVAIGAKDWKMSESGKVVVPEALKEELVIRIHEEIGHASRDAT